jgi:hypothetical protein
MRSLSMAEVANVVAGTDHSAQAVRTPVDAIAPLEKVL